MWAAESFKTTTTTTATNRPEGRPMLKTYVNRMDWCPAAVDSHHYKKSSHLFELLALFTCPVLVPAAMVREPLNFSALMAGKPRTLSTKQK